MKTAHRLAAVAAFLASMAAPAAAAQERLLVFDKRTVPGFGVESTTPSELDGIPDTIELIQYRVNPITESLELRGIAFRASGVCLGAWFDPFVQSRFVWADFVRTWSVRRVGRRDVAYVEGGQTIQPIAIGFGCK